MADAAGPVKLTAFPRLSLIERELFAGTASEVDLLAVLGDPSGENVPALGAGRPLFFWDLSYPCGLVMGLQFDQIDQRLTGFLDAPDVDHALRHLGIGVQDVWRLEEEEPDRFAAVCDAVPRTFAVARAGDPGAVVAEGLTERDARCRCDEAAAAGDAALVLVAGAGALTGEDADAGDADDDVLDLLAEGDVVEAPGPAPSGRDADAAPDLAGLLAARMGSRAKAAPPSDAPPPPPSSAGRSSGAELPASFDPGEEGGALESFEDDEFS